MWEFDCKQSWALKNWCFQTVVFEKTLESPLDWKEIKPVNPKANQPWIFIGRTDAEDEALILWPPDGKSQLIGIDFDVGKDRRQKEKAAAEDEMVRQHHWLNSHKSEQTLGDSEGQGSLVCCSPWGRKESDTTEQLNNNDHHDLLPFQFVGPVKPQHWLHLTSTYPTPTLQLLNVAGDIDMTVPKGIP